MKEQLDDLIKNLYKGHPPTEQVYTALLDSIDFVIDSSFKEFISNYDGAEGVKQPVIKNPALLRKSGWQ